MESQMLELRALVALGRNQGFLTYDQVSEYLPDEASSAEKLDELLVALERVGVEIIDSDDHRVASYDQSQQSGSVDERMRRAGLKLVTEESSESQRPTKDLPLAPAERTRVPSDPVRVYLSQMSEIPLLTREQEISLAKKIEITRRKFRRAVLGNDFALRHTLEILRKVSLGVLPFDRTIKVSLTEQLTKEQVSGRMPLNIATLDRLIDENRRDFHSIVRRSTPEGVKAIARQSYQRRRLKSLVLVEELSLRSRRVIPLMRQLEQYSQRMDYLQAKVRELRDSGSQPLELDRYRRELRHLIMTTQESPRSLRARVEEFRKKVAKSRHELFGFDPRRQYGIDASGGQVRVSTRI